MPPFIGRTKSGIPSPSTSPTIPFTKVPFANVSVVAKEDAFIIPVEEVFLYATLPVPKSGFPSPSRSVINVALTFGTDRNANEPELITPEVLTKWDKYDGINGTIESSCIYNKTIFLGTDKGLEHYAPDKNRFEHTEITLPVWDMCVTKNKLLIASDGLYVYDGIKYHYALETSVVYKVLVDKKDSNLLYIGGDNFIIKGILEGNKITILEEYETKGEVRSILQKNKIIYFSVNGFGIMALDAANKQIKNYTEKDGLPSLQDNVLFEYNSKIHIGTAKGIYTFNDATQKFLRNDAYNHYSEDYQIAKPTVVYDKIFYQVTGGKNEAYKIDEIASSRFFNNKLINDNNVLKRIKDVNAKHFYHSGNLVYISTNDGLFSYDLSYNKKPQPFITLISSVIFKDTTIYQNLADISNYNPTLEYTDNRIEFKLAATNYIDKEEMEFSYYIATNEKPIDKWVKNNTASFSNLTEGQYVFHAKSRDILGNEGKEISFVFTILPPWYRTIWAYIFYVFSFIALIIVIIKLYTRTLKERNIVLEQTITLRTKTIVEQKHELEHKNKEIVDSINYAQRIQKALLASDTLLNTNLKDYFVFFKPKDIVSGDFYWGTELNNNTFALVTADSTGHGVPGAIMSMLNISCLNEAVESQKLTNASDILNYTRSKIIKHLSNDGSEDGGKDGMDCSLIIFDPLNKQLHIAAANNPVWIIRKQVTDVHEAPVYELIEIKPDKMPVGKSDRQNQSFTLHTIELQQGDTIYTLTDGFPDQFGGPNGKKFMSKKLKELLLNNVHLPIHQQKELLDLTFKNWAGDLEQVDDVCVIGVRI